MTKQTDPIATIIAISIGAVAILAIAVFATLVILPVAGLIVGGYFLYRYLQLQELKKAQNAPAPIKNRPDYLDPKEFHRAISPRWLLNQSEEETGTYSCEPLAQAFAYIVATLYAQESFHEAPMKPDTSDRIHLGRYYDQLAAWQRKVSDENNLELFCNFLSLLYMDLREHFPPYAFQDLQESHPATLTTPLRLPDEAALKTARAFFDPDFKKRKLFEDIRAQFEKNVENDEVEPTFARIFAHTPFNVLPKVQLPIELPDETRFAGMWCVAPQGMGKTTLLHNLIAQDIEKDASIILMDSKGELIEPFLTHPALANRRIVIGPDNPIGMNPLDIPRTDINKTVENLEYLFSSLLDFKVTATQSMLLKAVLRSLVTAFPNPTLDTFQDLMTEGPAKYSDYIRTLEPDLRNFFLKEFYTENIKARRQEILQRLRLLLDHDLLRSMLMASSTTFHIGEAMDRGQFVIINNSRGRLGNQGAEFFGRFFIAQVLAAAQARSFRPDGTKKPVYFYIDECYTVIARDERITDILHECRSQKIALIMAHQETTQVSEKVLSALENCAIRFAHPDEEARKLAPSLRMDIKTLHSMKRGQFAAYIRGLSKDGIVVNVQKPEFSKLKLSRQSYQPQPLPPPTPVTRLEPPRPLAPAQPPPEAPSPSSPPSSAPPPPATVSSPAASARTSFPRRTTADPPPPTPPQTDPDTGSHTDPANSWS
jgi:hypothetical protein